MNIAFRSAVSKSRVSKSFAVAAATLAVAPLAHAQTPVTPPSGATSSIAPAPKMSPAKTFNRALDADLVAAVLGNNLSKVKSLLKDNADPNATSSDYLKTPALGCAATLGYLEMARVLVEAGADVEGADTQSNVPLMLASEADGAEMIRFLLQKGAKVDGDRKDGFTPLQNASASGKPQAARALIAGGADINSSKAGLLTPLMLAALKGQSEIVRVLIDAGANVNVRLTTNETALMYAAANTKSGNIEIVKMLVEAGADVSVKNDSGKFAHEIAGANKLVDVEKYLVDIFNRDAALYNVTSKAIRELDDKTGTSSTRLARWQEIKAELAKGANPRYTSISSGIPTLSNLIIALNAVIVTLDDNDATMKTIIARSDLDARMKDGGYTALHIAIDRDNSRLVAWLIKAGANLNISDDKNRTPLDMALANKRQNIITLLQNAGAKTYAQLK